MKLFLEPLNLFVEDKAWSKFGGVTKILTLEATRWSSGRSKLTNKVVNL